MTDITKKCKISGKEFAITDQDQRYYKKMDVPLPTLCPQERLRRRLIWRNEWSFYNRKCNMTGKDVLSIYAPDSPYNVIDHEVWFSDKWDPISYGQDYDFNRPFFEQFYELNKRVPIMNIVVAGNQNCDYVNQFGWSKNCYLCTEGDFNEDSLYSYLIYNSKSCIDCMNIYFCGCLYECIDCKKCNYSKYLYQCENCSSSAFLVDCKACHNCFGCIGLRQKKYYMFNQDLGEKEYKKRIKEFDFSNKEHIELARKKVNDFLQSKPRKYYFGAHNEGFTGENISDCKDCFECLDVKNCRDCKYCNIVRDAKDCYDMTVFGNKTELVYDSHCVGKGCQKIYFSNSIIENCSDIMYCDNIFNSKNIFGCCGLRHKEYCIFNKQYKVADYKDLKKRIIKHMKSTGEFGEFFPSSISPFAYNESVAQDYFPMKKNDAEKKGYKWKNIDTKDYKPQTYTVPESIEEVEKDICDQTLACEKCKKNYKIMLLELRFYKTHHISIPALCPDCRRKARIKIRNPRNLWNRQCDKCQKKVRSSFNPQRKEIVYCEECYHKEVY